MTNIFEKTDKLIKDFFEDSDEFIKKEKEKQKSKCKYCGNDNTSLFWCDECQDMCTKPSELECGNDCGFVEPYGFVPEAGCPMHDKIVEN
jgi:hypothetical protein